MSTMVECSITRAVKLQDSMCKGKTEAEIRTMARYAMWDDLLRDNPNPHAVETGEIWEEEDEEVE